MLAKLSIPALLPITFCLLSNCVNAQESGYKNKQVEYSDVKCHVVLTTGKAMISLWRIDKNQLTNIKQWIVGKKVTLPDSTKPSVVYKALSCIAGDAEFTSAKAKLLDENTAR
jgi:hypothetical protein